MNKTQLADALYIVGYARSIRFTIENQYQQGLPLCETTKNKVIVEATRIGELADDLAEKIAEEI